LADIFPARIKADIQRAMDLPYSTINTTIVKYKTSTTGTSSPRSVWKKIISDTDEQ